MWQWVSESNVRLFVFWLLVVGVIVGGLAWWLLGGSDEDVRVLQAPGVPAAGGDVAADGHRSSGVRAGKLGTAGRVDDAVRSAAEGQAVDRLDLEMEDAALDDAWTGTLHEINERRPDTGEIRLHYGTYAELAPERLEQEAGLPSAFPYMAAEPSAWTREHVLALEAMAADVEAFMAAQDADCLAYMMGIAA
jgi:hypothetical protein